MTDVETRAVEIEAGEVRLHGDLALPDGARAVVVFAHGSGSSRRSPRNIWVAERLHDARLGTLLFDLLTETESADRAKVFDIPLLGGRLTTAVRTIRSMQPGVPFGLFGASTGAAAALVAAAWPSRTRSDDAPSAPADSVKLTPGETRVARLAASGLTNREIAATLFITPRAVASILSRVYDKLGVRSRAVVEPRERHIDAFAIVSRGGRPDLAGDVLERVTAPTLLIVGERDRQVLELNRDAQARMRCETRLEIVPDATHLFEEPGALESVAGLAAEWFREHLDHHPESD